MKYYLPNCRLSRYSRSHIDSFYISAASDDRIGFIGSALVSNYSKFTFQEEVVSASRGGRRRGGTSRAQVHKYSYLWFFLPKNLSFKYYILTGSWRDCITTNNKWIGTARLLSCNACRPQRTLSFEEGIDTLTCVCSYILECLKKIAILEYMTISSRTL